MDASINTFLSLVEKFDKLEMSNKGFIIIVLIICFLSINMIMGTYKGRDPFYLLIYDRIKDTAVYLIREMKGNIVQQINAIFVISVFFVFLGFFFSFFFNLIVKSIFDINLLAFIFIFIFILGITMPICTAFTRSRY